MRLGSTQRWVIGLAFAGLLYGCGDDSGPAVAVTPPADDTGAADTAAPDTDTPLPDDATDAPDDGKSQDIEAPADVEAPEDVEVPEDVEAPQDVEKPEDVEPPMDEGGPDVEPPMDGGGGGSDVETGGPLGHPYSCANPPPVPVPWHTLKGFSGSEDFAFDDMGNLVSANGGGNLTRQPKEGPAQVWVPNSGIKAGTGFLPDGSLIGAGSGTLIKVAPNGATSVLLSGLQYPNGLDIDLDGTIYVAEQNGNRLRAVDPVSGEFEVIAEGLTNANGVSFGPQYQSIYVGSFGAGKVWRLLRNGDGSWGDAEVIADLPPPPVPGEPAPKSCEKLDMGAPCMTLDGKKGLCGGGESAECLTTAAAPDLFVYSCEGKVKDDSCVVAAYGTQFHGTCKKAGPTVYCAKSEDAALACAGKGENDGCVWLPLGYPTPGQCTGTEDGLSCTPGSGGGGGGGGNGPLDGLNVDECGYVWVTEWIDGIIWRIHPDGTVDKAADLPSSWIPNMHWGSGIGGWEKTVLYVMDRDQGRVFGLEIGLFGKEQTVLPAGDE